MTAQKLFTIAPHVRFLETLAENVCNGALTGGWDVSDPLGLADVTIILPTRRARLALADAFTRRLGGTALLPDIRTFGGEAEDEEPFLPPYDAPPVPPAIPALRRKLILSQLVEQWVRTEGARHARLTGFASPPSPGEILALSESLAELIDDCHVENLAPSALGRIETGDLSGYWEATLEFLQIALSAWSDVLAGTGEIDGAAARNEKLNRQAAAAPFLFGERPVIAAGSTGSIPATADLLKAVAELPRGALVLPGLDTTLDPGRFATLTDPARVPQGHPQYGLCRLLRRLGATPDAVTDLACEPAPRTRIVRQSLALAEHTAAWPEARAELAPAIAEAFAGVGIAVGRTDEEQARAVALAARRALEDKKTVGIVSPDRNLARRIAAELGRFDIAVDDSAGTPLFQTRTGRLVRQVLALANGDCAPVDLIALLRNRRAGLGLGRARITDTADIMERAMLRGQRPGPGIDGLRTLMQRNLDGDMPHTPHRLETGEAARIVELLDTLEHAIAPLTALFRQPGFSVAAFAEAVDAVMTAITAMPDDEAPEPPPEAGAYADWIAALKAETGGPQLGAAGIELSLEGLMAGVAVRAPQPGREDIAIWGQLEARLQNPDLTILAGLSEGVWPEAVDPGPWLSRAMAVEMGLEPPERRQGQATHDFEMAVGNAEVLITRSERTGTSPAVPSRLLQRIAAFIGKAETEKLEARGAVWVQRARDLDYAGVAVPAPRPAPNPPASERPKSLSVTEVEKLVRSPYDLYAKYVLGLRPLDPLGMDPDARERGTLVHEVFSKFVEAGHDPAALDALDTLMDLAGASFAALDAVPERRVLWRERFRTVAEAFLHYERARTHVAARHAERKGRWVLNRPDEPFTLRGQADRIDVHADGGLEIIDFKTGALPEPGEMRAFTAPQLLLEALMARDGAFPDVPTGAVNALTYIKLGFGPEAFVPKDFAVPRGLDLGGAVDEVLKRLSQQVDAYLYAERPMAARVFPDPKQRHAGDYDHLARTGEWTVIDGGEEGP